MTAPRRAAAMLCLVLLTATACVAVELEDEAGAPQVTELGDGEPAGDPTVEPPEEGEDLEVTLEILEGPGGGILAFVPVMIHGEGPFAFALDTGASASVLSADVADQLDLEVVGTTRGVAGVIGTTEAEQVQITDWHADSVDLGARPVVAMDLGQNGENGLQGLLGSDVLNQFGAITVDYEAGVLRLRPSGP
jgi:hypothetical protein